jgi:hypothetical protein
MTYYVSETAGNDANDGLTPATAWQTPEHAEENMVAGDNTITLNAEGDECCMAHMRSSGTTIMAATV